MGQKAVSAAPFLIGILENEENLNNENAKVLISTLLSLGKIKDPRAIDPLIKVLVSKDMDLQPWAMAALQNIGEPAVEPLITILKEKDTHVQAWAQDALVAMGEPAVEHLIIAIRDKDINVRANAAFALGRIKDNRAMEPLIVALKDEDAFVRRSAEIALAWVKDPRAVEPLIEALKDKDTYVQQFAAKALKAITGQNFGQNPAKWQEWWEKNKGKIGREK
jgi:HEAT repeat protein